MAGIEIWEYERSDVIAIGSADYNFLRIRRKVREEVHA